MPVEVYERFRESGHHILSAGWHFTFLGGAGRVTEKIRAYSHTEKWQQDMLHPGNVEQQMMLLKDVGGGRYLELTEVDTSFPKVVQDKYQHFVTTGLIKEARTRVRELQTLVEQFERANYRLNARCRYLVTENDRLLGSDLHRTNLALGRSATQSSVSRWSRGKTCEEDAKGGNNGMLSGLYGFHTDSEENPWWQVDLGRLYRIQEVRIFNRPDQAWRLRHFSILGSVDGQSWSVLHRKTDQVIFGHEKIEPYVVLLDSDGPARFVRIRLDGTEYLHFDECLVFGAEVRDTDFAH